ncbi:MAG: hypothetical protein ACKO6K_06045 [Chitinophagaceae bacterium]
MFLFRIIVLLVNLIIYYLPGNFDPNVKFYLLTVLLAGTVLMEVKQLWKQQEPYFYIHPFFLSLMVMFGLVFGGVVNFILYTEGGYFIKVFGYKLFEEREWLVRAMFIVNIAAVATAVGYHLQFGQTLYKGFRSIPLYNRILESDIALNRIFFFAAVAYLIKFYLFNIGLYGRILDEKYFDQEVGFKLGSQIRILGDFSYITFFIISLKKFKEPSFSINVAFYLSLVLEMFFGFIYGARSPFIIPILILTFTNYYVTRKIKVQNLLILLVVIYLAFSVVLEFKNYVLSKDFSRSSSTVEVIQSFSEKKNFYVQKNTDAFGLDEVFYTTLTSVTFVPEMAVAIRQKDKFGMDHLDFPNILNTLFWFPFDAFVPRFLQGQNEFRWGYWFKEEVIEMNKGVNYSIAMSPIGFLYMGGGLVLVILGFLVYGVLIRFAACFLHEGNLFSILLYFIISTTLINLDSIYSNSLIYLTRYLFIFSIILWFLIGSRNRESSLRAN